MENEGSANVNVEAALDAVEQQTGGAPEFIGADPTYGSGETEAVFSAERGEAAYNMVANPPAAIPVVDNTGTDDNDDDQTDNVKNTNPVVARDGDKIEPEWMARVQEVMKETKSDPRKREMEILALRKDYQKKRFGAAIMKGGE
jgi:hypothetical protein